MRESDTDNAVAIMRDIFWVGFFDETTSLHCNPYILLDEADVVLFDPGSIPDFPVVMRKVIDLVSPEAITWIVVSHQDPDVCGNLAVVEDVVGHDKLRIAAHTNTIRLINHLGLNSELYAVDENELTLELESGRTFDFLPVPFLHSPGAIATIDRKTRSLFSGDVFGAVSKDWTLFAGDGFPGNMDSFHQAYMPSNQVLRTALEKIERLDIERILPQHGSVIEGDQIRLAIDHLKDLPCGIDLIG